ncbi:hypothetical protein BDV23DRAFT_182077 [Aspergillus alliaceus]|uniref:Uncharacterized protein n=1 Tax=Petromyces alliaceus TaxID=209559 RepID=A0A5N7CCR7_PETAA|nr:hypothetical protein BDV23DRAFT_182077 [Aspergillus alliaceus]
MPGFDWADDVEDALQRYELLKPTLHFGWAEGAEDMFETYVESDIDISSEAGNDIAPDLEECLQPEDFYWDKELDEELEVEDPTEEESHERPWEICRPSVIPCVRGYSEISSTEPQDNSVQGFSVGTLMEEEVQYEFEFRDFCIGQDQRRLIHHFNWFGCPVYEPSGTPPAISLLFQMAKPKVPKYGDELRFQSIFSRATTFIDPVIVELEKGPDDLDRGGFKLVQFATGRTSKFYSLHGRWTEDKLERDECRTPDEGKVEQYQKDFVVCSNGLVSRCTIPSRYKWECQKAERHRKSESSRSNAWDFYMKKQSNVYKSSPLSRLIEPADIECTAGKQMSASSWKVFMLAPGSIEDDAKTLSDRSHEQELVGIPSDSIQCYALCVATDVTAAGTGLPKTDPQSHEIHTTANQAADIMEMYEDWLVVDTATSESSRFGMEATVEEDTLETLDGASGGKEPIVPILKGVLSHLGSLPAALKAWKAKLKKGQIAKHYRSICTKAPKVLQKRIFTH